MIMAIRFIEIKKKDVCGKKLDKSLVDMIEKGKLFSRRNFSFSHSIFQRANRSSYTSRNRYTSTASIFHLFHCLLCN